MEVGRVNSFDVAPEAGSAHAARADAAAKRSKNILMFGGVVAAVVIVVGIIFAIVELSGGGDTDKTTVTTTTTTIPPRSKPMTSAEAADYLNKLYMAFDKDDDTTDIGVFVSMAAQRNSFFGNQYCSIYPNPKLGTTACYNGQADCRMSAAVLSKNWMLNLTSNKLASFGGRHTGYVFNDTMVQTKWGKCSYIWDGATGNNLNRGCGNGAPGGNSCMEGSKSAWFNICDSGKTCTAEDAEIKRTQCDVVGGQTPVPPKHGGETQCFFPGPAIDFRQQDGWTPAEDKLREMAKQRIKYNDGMDDGNGGSGLSNSLMNNEVVLDEELLIPDYWVDPVAAIPAFIFTKSDSIAGRIINLNDVTKMRDEFCDYYSCSHGGGGVIPLVEVDDQAEIGTTGPFRALNAEMTV
jgi:hypothetical protein